MWGNFANCDADDFLSLKFEASDIFKGHICTKKKEKTKKETQKEKTGLEKKKKPPPKGKVSKEADVGREPVTNKNMDSLHEVLLRQNETTKIHPLQIQRNCSEQKYPFA